MQYPNNDLEQKLKKAGYNLIVGIDEVGRGAWAGPLYAGAVILPNKVIPGIKDSKLLSPAKREELAKVIIKSALGFGYGRVEPREMEKIGMTKATLLAFKRALQQLKQYDYILTDYFQLEHQVPSQGIQGGDRKVISISAGSIIAKVERDRVMGEYGKKYPKYQFEKNKGYPSPNHRQALKKYLPCPIHRRNFRPIATLLNN